MYSKLQARRGSDNVQLPRQSSKTQLYFDDDRIGERKHVEILTKVPCPTPELIRKEIAACPNQSEQTKVLLRLLGEQKVEASAMVKAHQEANLSDKAEQLSKVADQTAYAIAIFNRRLQQRKRILYNFTWINMPTVNQNSDLPSNVLEVTELRGHDFVQPSDAGTNFDVYAQLEMSFPMGKKSQLLKSGWTRYSNGGLYNLNSNRFDVSSTGSTFPDFLRLEDQVKVMVYYNRGPVRKAGLLGWGYITISDLLNAPTITKTINLNAEGGMIRGKIQVTIRQRESLKGPKYVITRKPWMVLMVDDIPTMNEKRSSISTSDVPLRPNSQQQGNLQSKIADIMRDLRHARDEPDNPNLVPCTSLRMQMSVLADSIRTGTFVQNDIGAYVAELAGLLGQFKARIMEEETRGQIKTMARLIKRSVLIKDELFRYGYDWKKIQYADPKRSSLKYLEGNPSDRQRKESRTFRTSQMYVNRLQSDYPPVDVVYDKRNSQSNMISMRLPAGNEASRHDRGQSRDLSRSRESLGMYNLNKMS